MPQPYRRGGQPLAIFIAVYLLSFWFAIAGGVGNAAIYHIGSAILVFESYAMFLVDWRGLTTLSGRVAWARLSGGMKFLWAFALIFFVEFVLAVYFFFAVKDHLAATHQAFSQVLHRGWQNYLSAFRQSRFIVGSLTAIFLIAFVTLSSLAVAGGYPTKLNDTTDRTTTRQPAGQSYQTPPHTTATPTAVATPTAAVATAIPTPKPRDGYGIYEDCDPHFGSSCGTRLNNIAAGGFSEVMDYSAFSSDTTIDDVLAYAAYANQLGIKIIWPIDDFNYSEGTATDVLQRYPRLVQSIGSSGLCNHSVTDNYWLVACITVITSGHPGTWGYYIGDELPASDEPQVRHVVDAILDWNESAWRLFMAQDPGGYLNSSEVYAYGRYYSDGYHAAPDASVIAQDYYPIGTSQQTSAATTAGQIAASLNSFANRQGISYGIALQADSLSEYKSIYPWCTGVAECPYPTASQEKSMQSAVLAQGLPQIVMWYSYFDLVNSDNYTKHWTDLSAVV